MTATKLGEEIYRAMFENAGVGITRVDLKGVLVESVLGGLGAGFHFRGRRGFNQCHRRSSGGKRKENRGGGRAELGANPSSAREVID